MKERRGTHSLKSTKGEINQSQKNTKQRGTHSLEGMKEGINQSQNDTKERRGTCILKSVKGDKLATERYQVNKGHLQPGEHQGRDKSATKRYQAKQGHLQPREHQGRDQ
jgi:hypothetical protein